MSLKAGVPVPKPKVEPAQKGKKSVGWRNDPVILARLAAVAEIMLMRGTAAQIAETFDCSLATAKRDISRVRMLWKEQARGDINSKREESLAEYRLIQTRAWVEFRDKRNPRYLEVIMNAQDRIVEIEGTKAPEQVDVGVTDINKVREERWSKIKETLAHALDEPTGEENDE